MTNSTGKNIEERKRVETKANRISFLEGKNQWLTGRELFQVCLYSNPLDGFNSPSINLFIYKNVLKRNLPHEKKRAEEMYHYLCEQLPNTHIEDWKPLYYIYMSEEEQRQHFSKEYIEGMTRGFEDVQRMMNGG